MPHIGIVSDQKARWSDRYLVVVHNVGKLDRNMRRLASGWPTTRQMTNCIRALGSKNGIIDEDFGFQERITVWRGRLADDRDIWERISGGDESAFDALYRMYGPKMQIFLRRLLGSSQAAEDVMQETFAAIWQHPNGFAVERGTLRAYLFGAARKRAADWWRKQGVSGEQVQSEPTRCDTEMVPLVTDAVSRLSQQGRILIWLREVEGYSYDELAQILEIPAGTVASRLFAAREELRNIWQTAPREKKGDL